MASGFGLRVLLLPLIIYGQLALGNIYRYRSENRPHNEQAGASSQTYSPVSSSYDGFVHPRALNAKFPEGSKASVSGQGPSRFFSGQVDSYSPSGSVPSYKPASLQLKPSQAQRPQSSFHQVKPRMWETTSLSGRKGSNIVSSGAIVMQAEKTPEQRSSSPSGVQGKTSTWDASSVQSPGLNFPGRLPPNHPAFSAPAVLQSKAGMWDSLFASSAQSPGLFSPVEPPQNPVTSAPPVPKYKAGVWEGTFASSVQSPVSNLPGRLPPNHPAFSAPAVLQSKAGMWDSLFASSAQSPAEFPQNPTLPQNKPGVWDSISASSLQSPVSSYPGRLPPNHPAFSTPAVLQSKDGMWDSIFATSPQSLGSFPPVKLSQNPEPPVMESKSTMWKSVPASKLQSSVSNLPGRLPPNHPAFSTPAVLQTKAGMWDSVFASSGQPRDIDPRSSRPEASGSYPSSQQQPRLPKILQPASSVSQSGGLGDKAALKPFPRSSKPVPVSTLFHSGGRQHQLDSTHRRQPSVS